MSSSQKFQVIVIDPPYSFSDKLTQSKTKRGAQANYKTMPNMDIAGLDIAKIANPDGAILALWVPSAILGFGLDLMKVWGFIPKQSYIWVKQRKQKILDEDLIKQVKQSYKDFKAGVSLATILTNYKVNLQDSISFYMGRLFRNTHEICLIGINNNKIYKSLQDKSQRTVCFSENLKHSAKPENLQDSLDKMFSGPKIEIFARRQRPNWICLGNEVPMSLKEDIIISLKKTINLSESDYQELIKITDEKDLFNRWSQMAG